MCDVTNSNFEALFPTIERAIDSSAFLALDGEFTCLYASNSANPSLTDTPEIRYGKLKRNVNQSTLCQFGISAFIPNPNKENSYCVETFNFYLFPHSYGPADCRFLCQASSIEFLCENKFDFNKFMYEGIPYLNKDQEKVLREMHHLGKVQNNCSSFSIRSLNEAFVRGIVDEIYQWSVNAATKAGDQKSLSIPVQGIGKYIILAELRDRFKDIKCQFTSGTEITVTKQGASLHAKDIQDCFDREFEKLIQAQIGFSRVVRLLSESRKPLVGHNCLTDFLFLFEKFHRALPETYKEFKNQLHDLFPVIYDTKHLSSLLKRTMKGINIFNETRLEDLHAMLSSKQGMFYVLYSPHVAHAVGFDNYVDSNRTHEAGYDAYLTGYVFLRMAHFLAAKDARSEDMRPLKFKDHLLAVRDFKNSVNIARASLRYINIGAEDPPFLLPERFLVSLKEGSEKTLSAVEVAHEFLPFGSVDVQLINAKQALVAVSHKKRAKAVVGAFRHHNSYKVVHADDYSRRRIYSRIFGGCVCVFAAGTVGYFLISRMKK